MLPLLPTFVAGLLLWILGTGAWATAGMVITLLTGGIAIIAALVLLAGFIIFWKAS